MKYLKLYEEFDGSGVLVTLDEINDLFLDLMDDGKCEVTGEEYFKKYIFTEGFHEMVDLLESWGVKNYIRDHKAQLIYVYDKELESFFLGFLNGCVIFDSKKYPGKYLIWRKDGYSYFAQDLKNQEFWVDYAKIWSVFESKYSMNYLEIQAFTEHMLYEHTELRGYTTTYVSGNYSSLLYEHTELRGYTTKPVFAFRV